MKRLLRLAVVVSGIVGMLGAGAWAQGVKAETPPATFEAGLAKVLQMEEDAEFARAIQVGDTLLGQFASHPDADKLREILYRLKEEKNEASVLLPAVEKLGSADEAEVNVAKGIFETAGDTGVIILGKAVRTGSSRVAETAVCILEGMDDATLASSYVVRLSTEGQGSLGDALVRVLDKRLRAMDKDARATMAGPLGRLYDVAAADTTFQHRNAAGRVLLVYLNWFEMESKPFETFLERPGAVEALKNYVVQANKSKDRLVWEWAGPWLPVVGLEVTRGLVGWWKLNDQKGDVARDSSGSGFDGTLKNGPAWVAGRRQGGALSFNGNNNFVEMNTHLPELALPFSITCWVNPAETQVEYADILGNHGDNLAGLVMQQDGNKTNRFGFGYMDGKNGYGPGTVQLAANAWQHVAVVCDGENALCYVNGEEKAKSPAKGSLLANPKQNFKLGQGYHTGRFFRGLLSDVRIYSRALTAEEIGILARQ